MTHGLLALVGFIPAMVGPLPGGERVLVAQLCGGGTITIPVGGDEPQEDPMCHKAGCHAQTCRRKFDLRQ